VEDHLDGVLAPLLGVFCQILTLNLVDVSGSVSVVASFVTSHRSFCFCSKALMFCITIAFVYSGSVSSKVVIVLLIVA
jgi:hypothetical protein